MSQEVIPVAGFWAGESQYLIRAYNLHFTSFLQNRLRQYKGRDREVRKLLLWPEGGDLDQDSWEELLKNSYTNMHIINAYPTEFAKGEN